MRRGRVYNQIDSDELIRQIRQLLIESEKPGIKLTVNNGTYLSSPLSLYQSSYGLIIGECFREVNRRRRSRRGIRKNFHRLFDHNKKGPVTIEFDSRLSPAHCYKERAIRR